MANPELLNLSSVKGESAFAVLTTVNNYVVQNAAASNQLYKVQSIIVSNSSTTNTHSVTCFINRSSTFYNIASAIDVPPQSTLVLLSKDSFVYLMEGDQMGALASASTDLEILISYDVME